MLTIDSLSKDIRLDRFISECEFTTLDREIGTVLVTRPKDVECSEQQAIDNISERLTKAWRILDTRFRVYQYWLRSKGTNGLYVNRTYLVMVFGNSNCYARPQIYSRPRYWVESELSNSRAILSQKLSAWINLCSDFWPMRVSTKEEAFHLFWGMFNPGKPVPSMMGDLRINKQIVGEEIDWTLRGGMRIGDKYSAVISLQALPEDAGDEGYPVTTSCMLDPMFIDADFTLCVQSHPLSPEDQRKYIRSAKRTQYAREIGISGYVRGGKRGEVSDKEKNQEAVAQGEALGQAQAAFAAGNRLGEFSLSVCVYADSPSELEMSVEAVKSSMDIKARMVREGVRKQIVFFSMCPGNSGLSKYREMVLSDANLADFSIVFGDDSGNEYSSHLNKPAAIVLKTKRNGPYFWTWHTGDVGHKMISGKTGSGKTMLTQALLYNSFRKYGCYVSITDLAGSYKELTRMCAGSYVRVEIGSDHAKMNPIGFPDSKEQRDFATALVVMLIEQRAHDRGKRLNAEQVEEIHRSVVQFYESDEPRSLGRLCRFLDDEYHGPMRRWVEPGQYAWLLDNEDAEMNSNEFQTHEFVGFDDEDHRDLLDPLFMAKFHMDTMRVRDRNRIGQLKILAFDELAFAMRSDRCVDYLRVGLKKARAFNTVVVLATQSPKDASESPIWHVINQCCDKIVLADPEMTVDDYIKDYGFSNRQSEIVQSVRPKGELFCRNAGESGKVLVYEPTAIEKIAYATDAPTVLRRQELIDTYGTEEWTNHIDVYLGSSGGKVDGGAVHVSGNGSARLPYQRSVLSIDGQHDNGYGPGEKPILYGYSVAKR